MNLLEGVKRIHFIGIGGSGTYPLVQILASKGYSITGSDVLEGDTIEAERKMGVQVHIGHAAQNVEGADLVCYTAALLPGNPELEHAKALGIPCIERSVMLGIVADFYKKPVCISGTHGKTTTTAMLTQVLVMCGKDPAAVIGGKLPLINGYGKDGKGDEIVVEACEFSNTFLELNPYISVLLNIDNDHMDFFKTMENLKASFITFAKKAAGFVVANGDDENTLDVLSQIGGKAVVTFGTAENATFRACNIHEHSPALYAFDVTTKGEKLCEVRLSVPGRHNVYNALAAFTCAVLCGCAPQQIADALATFKGAGRRFEFLCTANGITVADDYAHHPAELEATLKAAKSMKYNKVIAVFQPFTYSRTKMLLNEFAEVLQLADNVVMTEIMGSREVNTYNIYTKDLAALIPGSVWYNTFEEVSDCALALAKEGDLIITLGCGDIYKAAKIMAAKLGC